MKTLFLFRHAKASRDEPVLDDYERELNERGRTAAALMGQFFRQQKLPLDLIISSTALRARQTTELFIPKAAYQGVVEYTRVIYEASGADLLQLLNDVPTDHHAIMLIGHNPAFEELCRMLTGKKEEIPTAAIARIELPLDDWRELGAATKGRLVDLWKPREI